MHGGGTLLRVQAATGMTRIYSYVSRTDRTMVMPAFKARKQRRWTRFLALVGVALVCVVLGAALGLLYVGWLLS